MAGRDNRVFETMTDNYAVFIIIIIIGITPSAATTTTSVSTIIKNNVCLLFFKVNTSATTLCELF